MSHYESDLFETNDPALERLVARPIEVENFEVGKGRPDLERISQIIKALDQGYPSLLQIRNEAAAYLNERLEADREGTITGIPPIPVPQDTGDEHADFHQRSMLPMGSPLCQTCTHKP